MMELIPFILKALLPKYKTIQPTRTETITTITGTVPELKAWKAQTFAGMTERAAVKPTRYEIPTGTKPVKTGSGVVTGDMVGSTRRGITGGPPVTITKETVKYATGPIKRV